MDYRVWFQCNQGKYYLTHDCFLGYGDLTKTAREATKYKEPLTKEAIEKFLKEERFNVTILVWGNEEVK